MGQNHPKLAPTQIEDLTKRTVFTREELKLLFEKFITDYPTGYMTKEQFTKVYRDYYKKGDCNTFSEHVFRVFDVNHDNRIDFREFICSLSLTTRGSIEEKLHWAFNMYDVNGDGRVSIAEVGNIVNSVQALVNAKDKNLNSDKIEQIFHFYDNNQDGTLTVDEFIRGSKSNPMFMRLLTDYIQ
ncbi:neurocalcin-delta-like [Hydractinia symbiolongicarpus]|uniref:neurocalcin-delta-like n=1 Tax=Hydractinia symbiolongicarpus TaxID=13093 RepID=UPI00254FC5F5|nr:neurocalcin-delta-like [Hydractinia symbiolongicarpus]